MGLKVEQTIEVENIYNMSVNGGFTSDFSHVKMRVILQK